MLDPKEVTVEIRRDGKGYQAHSPQVGGCRGWGMTRVDALRNLEDALTVEAATRRNGRRPPPDALYVG